jgi:ribosomal protein S24E
MIDVDILEIDLKIIKNFEEHRMNISVYEDKKKDLEQCLMLESITQRTRNSLIESLKNLEDFLVDLRTNRTLNFYTIESAEILEKYRNILKEPLKVNFMGKAVKSNKEKKKLIFEYLDIASRYFDIKLDTAGSSPEPPPPHHHHHKKEKISCNNCNNTKDFEVEEGDIYICLNCSSQQFVMRNTTSYKDINRINISSKYMYDRKIHFRDCINQYQGKQNSNISQKVYDDLIQQFESHHLIEPESKHKNSKERFKNITKEHVSMFLKELSYTKHYENVNLIHYNLTGIKPDDIGYLEDKLLDDFDVITEAYDRLFKHLDRKNFINTQYILYQLLLRHKHTCKKEDFSMLKTIDRKNFHDEICKVLFEEIKFSFLPLY